MNTLLQRALAAADETRALHIGANAISQIPELFREQFGNRPAMIVADPRTYQAAGHAVLESLRADDFPFIDPFHFQDEKFYAEHSFVEALANALASTNAIPVAVGSGSINDVTKLAAHRCHRPYMAVATAASMDGYTASGASITFRGSKQTFNCPAPQAVVADLGVIAAAPPELNAAGYADLMAKITAGADWILADALGVEAIDPTAWSFAQASLKDLLENPDGIRSGVPAILEKLVGGLMMGGVAMQWMKSSRCASGAEHQFSHLWDMQHHTHLGVAPSHGFKVGIATLAITRLYEHFLEYPSMWNAEAVLAAWPPWPQCEARLRTMFDIPEILEKALEETRAKYLSVEELRSWFSRLEACWPDLQQRLRHQLVPSSLLRNALRTVGAPVDSTAIGISSERLNRSHHQAAYIRRRFTILDFALQTNTLDAALQTCRPRGSARGGRESASSRSWCDSAKGEDHS